MENMMLCRTGEMKWVVVVVVSSLVTTVAGQGACQADQDCDQPSYPCCSRYAYLFFYL